MSPTDLHKFEVVILGITALHAFKNCFKLHNQTWSDNI